MLSSLWQSTTSLAIHENIWLNCSHSCQACGLNFQLAETNDLLLAANMSGGDLKKILQGVTTPNKYRKAPFTFNRKKCSSNGEFLELDAVIPRR